MSTVLNALLMIPVMFLMRLLINEISPFSPITQRIAYAVSWKSKEWHQSGKRLTDIHYYDLTKTGNDDYDLFNKTLEAMIIPRIPGTEGHRKVRKFIEDKMSALSWDVNVDHFTAKTPHGNVQFANVIATLDPYACKRLVFACHYDSKIMVDGEFEGATDSAVPCSMMIHLVTVLNDALQKHKNSQSDTTLQLIFFDGEEAFEQWNEYDSIYGSKHLAHAWNRMELPKTLEHRSRCGHLNDLASELDRMEVMVLLDLLGSANPNFYSYFSNTNSLYSRFVKIEQKLNDIQQLESHPPQSRTNYFIESQSFGGIEDDHIPFLHRGVPIVHVIPSPFPSVWHTLSDNRNNLHHPTINNLLKIFKLFIVQYLHLEV